MTNPPLIPYETTPMSDMSTLDGSVLLQIARAVERFENTWRRGEPMWLEDLLREADVA